MSSGDSPHFAAESLSRQLKPVLKELCRERNLNVSGNKSDLIERLLQSDDGTEDFRKSRSTAEMNGGSPRGDIPAAAAAGAAGAGAAGAGASPALRRARTLSQTRRRHLKEEREGIVLWRRPLTTVTYGAAELGHAAAELGQRLLAYKAALLAASLAAAAVALVYNVEGSHRQTILDAEKYLLWCLWWIGLGVLSSVGLGTGLHTFLLYLGPHIAAVTMAAYECGSVDFPSPPYPDSIVCPDENGDGGQEEGTAAAKVAITIWHILSKVRVEAFCWGAGTALGELPPYFMARAHRLSGYDPDEEEDEFDELQEKAAHPEQLSLFDRAKLGVERIVERVGFLGILACASIPNPLFDLAGITCGHFLVPFWTFFGATLIGKAVVKMHIQKFFVILAFNEDLISSAVSLVSRVPMVGAALESPVRDFLAKQKEKLHRKAGQEATAAAATDDPNILAWLFEKVVLLMVGYFLLSILNSLAQGYHKRIHRKKKGEEKKE